MKKLFKVALFMLALAVAAPMVSAQTYGMTEKEIKANKKEAEKQAKKAAKQIRKEKWVYPGANTLENELTNYLLATTFSNGSREEMVENVPQASSIRRGESMARSAAENDFARELQVAIAVRLSRYLAMPQARISSSSRKSGPSVLPRNSTATSSVTSISTSKTPTRASRCASTSLVPPMAAAPSKTKSTATSTSSRKCSSRLKNNSITALLPPVKTPLPRGG